MNETASISPELYSNSHGLRWILAPLTLEQFVAEYWQMKPYVVTGRPSCYLSAVCSIASLELTLPIPAKTNEQVARALNVHRAEQSYEDLRRRFLEGDALLFEDVDRRVTPVRDLCKDIEFEMHALATADAWYAPAQSQGQGIQHSAFDSLILQIESKTVWDIWHPSGRYPLKSGQLRPSAVSRNPDETFELDAGQTLYLPRGFDNVNRTIDRTAFYVRLKIQPMTWLDLLSSAAEVAAERHVELRKALPRHFLSYEEPTDQMKELWDRSSEILRAAADWKTAKSELGRKFLERQRPIPIAYGDPLSESHGINDSSVLKKRPRTIAFTEFRKEFLKLHFSGGSVLVPVANSAAIDFILNSEAFTPSEIPGLESAARLQLVRHLINVGLLLVESRSSRQ